MSEDPSNGIRLPLAASADGCCATHDFGEFLRDRGLARLVVDQLHLVDQVAGVVGRGLHRDHARGLLGRDVLGQRLVHQRLDVTLEQLVDHRRRVGLVEVVPAVLLLLLGRLLQPLGRQRQQLLDHRLLAHRVDEARVAQVDRVDAPFDERVEDQPHRPDQPVELRRVAELGDLRDHLRADPVHEPEPLVADRDDFGPQPLVLHLAQAVGQRAQDVGVQAAAQPLVGGDDDVAYCLGVAAVAHVRALVLGVGLRQVGGDVADLVGVRPRRAHALLRPAHLRRGDHLHRLGALLRVLEALDLDADFLAGGHRGCSWSVAQAKLFLNAAIAAPNSSSAALSIAFSVSSLPSSAAWLDFRCWCRPCSNASTRLTSTSSTKPLLTANSDAAISEIGSGAYCGCLSTSVTRAPRSSCLRVASSRSDANCANAASSRYCARSVRMPPESPLISLVWAALPTRETEMPALIAGRMPALNRLVSRKIWPSVIEITLVGTNADTSPAWVSMIGSAVSDPVWPLTAPLVKSSTYLALKIG